MPKGFFRRHFADHGAIRQLKNLLTRDVEVEFFSCEAVYICFQNHPLVAGRESYKIFLNLLNYQVNQLAVQYEKALQASADSVAQHLPSDYGATVEELLNTILTLPFLSGEARQALHTRLDGINVTIAESSLPSQAVNPYTLCPSPRYFENNESPEHMICPISGDIMQDPAYLKTNSKYICERAQLVAWVSQKHTCPSTRKPCTEGDIVRH